MFRLRWLQRLISLWSCHMNRVVVILTLLGSVNCAHHWLWLKGWIPLITILLNHWWLLTRWARALRIDNIPLLCRPLISSGTLHLVWWFWNWQFLLVLADRKRFITAIIPTLIQSNMRRSVFNQNNGIYLLYMNDYGCFFEINYLVFVIIIIKNIYIFVYLFEYY